MVSDWENYAIWRARKGATPIEIVRELALPAIFSRMAYFGLGFIVGQVPLILLFFYGLSQMPSFQRFGWGIAFSLGFFGVGLLGTQLLLIYDAAHHAVFKSPKWQPLLRFSIVALAFTLAAFPLLQFVPTGEVEYGLNHPAYELYNRISAFTVTLGMPYLAKIFFDWFPIKKTAIKRLPIAMASILVVLLTIVTTIGTAIGVFNPSASQIIKYSLYTALLGAGLTIGLVRGTERYRDGSGYSNDASSIGSLSSTLERITKSKRISTVAGINAGLGIPLVAGINHASSVGVELEHLNIIILLLVGYVDLVVTIVFWVIIYIVLGGLLSLFLAISLRILSE